MGTSILFFLDLAGCHLICHTAVFIRLPVPDPGQGSHLSDFGPAGIGHAHDAGDVYALERGYRRAVNVQESQGLHGVSSGMDRPRGYSGRFDCDVAADYPAFHSQQDFSILAG